MKPVTQTTCDSQEGNCFAACLASLLEADIDIVPNICAPAYARDDWDREINIWLVENFGVWWFDFSLPEKEVKNIIPTKAYHLMCGESSRERLHSVVGQGGHMVWDPHPDRSGLLSVQTYGVLVPTELHSCSAAPLTLNPPGK